jgi:electron transfer flavoprotein alpha subunit
MPGIWALGDILDGSPSRLTLELATLARDLAAGSGSTATTVLIGPGASGAAAEVATYGTNVLAVDETGSTERPAAAVVAPRLVALIAERDPELLLVGATPDGKDIAGALLGLIGWPVLVNASAVEWEEDGPTVAMDTWGGRLTTRNRFTVDRGIVLVRPGAVTAQAGAAAGAVESVAVEVADELSDVRVTDRVVEAGAQVPIEEARVIVAGGRGVGSAEGFQQLQELADLFGGAVGATRAVVDSGWIGYAQQIGQTGKSVKPALYIAAGISGAIQHKVGIQTAGAIIAINKDADAPIAAFADLVVVGDLNEIVPRLTEAVRARKG